MAYDGPIVVILWLMFAGYWLISSLHAKRSISRKSTWATWRVAFAIILLILIRLRVFTRLGRHPLLHGLHHPWINDLGVVLCVAGLALAVWARVYLGRNWGMPMTVKAHPELVTAGPYSVIRHPIYTGLLLATLGTALSAGFIWFLILLWTVPYYIYSALREQKLMTEQFPNQYPAYMQKTKVLIPFVF